MATRPKAGTRTRGSSPATLLSIVVPLFNEARGLPGLHERIAEAARYLQTKHGLSLDLIYVDDGSSDGTSDIARSLPAMSVDVSIVDGALKLTVPGQPIYTLFPDSPTRFRLGGPPGMPAGFFAEFSVENGVAKSVTFIQPNGSFVLSRK